MDTGKAHRNSHINPSFAGTQGGDDHEEKTRVDTKTEAKRPALPQRLWKKLGLNMGIVILMSKYVHSLLVIPNSNDQLEVHFLP